MQVVNMAPESHSESFPNWSLIYDTDNNIGYEYHKTNAIYS